MIKSYFVLCAFVETSLAQFDSLKLWERFIWTLRLAEHSEITFWRFKLLLLFRSPELNCNKSDKKSFLPQFSHELCLDYSKWKVSKWKSSHSWQFYLFYFLCFSIFILPKGAYLTSSDWVEHVVWIPSSNEPQVIWSYRRKNRKSLIKSASFCFFGELKRIRNN